MSKKHIYFPQQPGISRRDLLKGAGYGLAGSLLVPKLVTAPAFASPAPSAAGASASLVWDIALPNQAYGSSIYDGGTLWAQTFNQKSSKKTGLGTVVYRVDTNSGNVPIEPFAETSSNTTASVVDLAVNDNVLYWINAADILGPSLNAINSNGAAARLADTNQIVTSNLVMLNGQALFCSSPFPGANRLNSYSYSASSSNAGSFSRNWSVTVPFTAQNSFSTLLPSNGQILVVGEQAMYAVTPNAPGAGLLWNVTLTSLGLESGPAIKQVAICDGLAFIVAGVSLYAVQVPSGQLSWKYEGDKSDLLSAPVAYNGRVYVGTQSGKLLAFYTVGGTYGVAGSPSFNEGLKGDLSTALLLIEDGVLYLSGNQVYAVNLDGSAVVTYDPGTADSASAPPYLLGGENTVVYFTHNNSMNIAAADLGSALSGFFAESELMADSYDTSQKPSNPTFRTHIQLLHPNKNPRVYKGVKVWSNDASNGTSIQSGNNSYMVGLTQYAWLTTDEAGELEIVSTTNDISTPALYLWANFMDSDEAIVVYPDQDTTARLAGIQASDLQSMQSYDGTPLVSSTYSGADLSAVATTINNSLGNTQQATIAAQKGFMTKANLASAQTSASGHGLGHRRRRLLKSDPNTYVAYPSPDQNILFQPTQGDTTRPLAGVPAAGWSLTLSTLPSDARGSLQGVGSFDDFFKNVVHGAENIAKITATVVKDATTGLSSVTHDIVSDLNKAYSIIAEKLEDAIVVVAGILKTIAGDISRVVQALSYLFDWSAIAGAAAQIQVAITNNITNIQNALTNTLRTDINSVKAFFTDAENGLASAISSITGSLPQQLQTPQQTSANNNPQTTYGANGSKSYTKSRWFTSKVKNNANSGTGDAPDVTDLMSQVDLFFSTVQTQLTSNKKLTGLIKSLQDSSQTFKTSFLSDPTAFVNAAFADIINFLGVIGEVLLVLAEAVVEGLLDLLNAVLSSVLAFLKAKIHIPVISDIIGDLSAVEIISYAIAIPALVISKLASGVGSSDLLTVAAVLASAIFMIFDPIMDIVPSPVPILSMLYIALSAGIMGFGAQSYVSGGDGFAILFVVLQALPLLVGIAGVDISKLPGAVTDAGWQVLSTFFAFVYGIVQLVLSIIGAVEHSAIFAGKDYLTLVSNIFTFLPQLCKWGDMAEEEGRIAVGLIDFACDAVVAALAVAELA